MNHAIPTMPVWPGVTIPDATQERRRGTRGHRRAMERPERVWAERHPEDQSTENGGTGERRSRSTAPGWDDQRPDRPRGPRSSRRGRGDVKAAVLLLLAEKPRHGYEILTELSARSGGNWKASPGSIYPVLKNLTRKGLVRPQEEDGRRVFHLTEAGETLVAKESADWGTPWKHRVTAPNPAVQTLQEETNRLSGAVRQVAQSPDQDLVQRVTQTLIAARKAIFLALAEETELTATAATKTDADEPESSKATTDQEDTGAASAD